MDWQDAWTFIRCEELEDGASICCSEECEEHDSAILELVMAAEAGTEKRKARQSGRAAPASLEAAVQYGRLNSSDYHENMKKISYPLVATTDPLKLKELEDRFPGGTIMLDTSYCYSDVKYLYEDIYEDSRINHFISFNENVYSSFNSVPSITKFRLTVHWEGMSADLSHFF